MLEIYRGLRSNADPEKEVWSTSTDHQKTKSWWIRILHQATGESSRTEPRSIRKYQMEPQRWEIPRWSWSSSETQITRAVEGRRSYTRSYEDLRRVTKLLTHNLSLIIAGVGYLKRMRVDDLKDQEATLRDKIEQNKAATERKSQKSREETCSGSWTWGT